MARKQADWMCTLDERIIERVDEDSLASARHLDRTINFDASKRRIEERLGMLTYAGLVAPIYDGADMYEITGEGQRYLEGDLDAEHLPRPHPRAV
jgi:DNA-binding transcriptional ArsR family regulator